ncbi:MAG: DUF1553 domain-containing protein [Planctomycetaceae bacterium]|nr:MAG: DUF1553 domain-containing protein [Planctomycetaceae bacterium]
MPGSTTACSDRPGPRNFWGAVAVWALTVLSAVPVLAEEPLRAQIDRLIALQTSGYEKLAAPLADDAEFLRRVSLDLTGTIPTATAARAFLTNPDSGKREKLVESLLASPEYARHMQRQFDVLLMRRLPQKHVPIAEWEKFLRESFAANKPWDQIAREILSSDGSDPGNRGPARFYLDREGDAHVITKDVARLFLGLNFDCTQCHDHPQIEDYKQDHYYGVSAFFVRSFVMTDKEKRVVFAEKADGEATFESVFEIRDKTSKGPKTTLPKFIEASAISEPKFEKPDEAYAVKPDEKDKEIRPVPRFSRRAKFAEFLASGENRRFCRSSVNRVWAMLLGRGLVHPLDLDHSENPPSHPLLLAHLADQFAAHKLDLKWLIREIVLSETYQRSSRSGSPEAAPPEAVFARAQLKTLTPAQFAWAVMQATGEVDAHRVILADQATEQALYDKLIGYEQRFVQLFGGEPGKPPADFEATADQTLFLSNDPAITFMVKPKAGNTADRLMKLPADNIPAIAEELFLSTLTRLPTPEDIADIQSALAGATPETRPTILYELVWAAISSAEFRFNH